MVYRICGHPGEFELEFQVLNWVLLTSAFLGILLTIENFSLQFPFPAAESTLLVTAICLGGYYLVRIKKKFSRFVAPLLYAAFLIAVTFIWFESNGLAGAMPYFYIVPILAGMTIMHGRLRTIVLSVTILDLLALIAIERIAPQLVHPYPSEYARWIDTLIGVVYAVSYGLGYIAILMSNLNFRIGKARQSAAEYQQLIEAVPDAVVRTNTAGDVVFINDQGLRLTGITREEITGRNMLSFLPPEEIESAVQNIALMMEQPVGPREYHLLTGTKEKILGEVNGSVLRDEHGAPYGTVFIVRDIGERKRVEEALRESEAKYKFLVENTSDITWIFDLASMSYTFGSHALERILGYNTSEAVGLKLEDIFSPQTRKAVQRNFVKAMADGSPSDRVRMEAEHIAKNGARVWMEINAVAQRDGESKVVAFVGTTRDISERKRAEEALLESEEKLRRILNSLPHFVSIYDMNLNPLYMSPSVFNLTGYTPEERLKLRLEDYITPEYIPGLRELLTAGLAQEQSPERDPNLVVTMEMESIRKDGSRFPMESTLTFLRDLDGVPKGVLALSSDITERKNAETALKESERRLGDIINFLPMATFVINRDGRVTAWNRAMEEITGVKQEDMVWKGDHEYALPFYGERRPILIDLVFASEEELASKYSHIRREGEVLTAEAFIPKLGKNGIILVGYASPLRNTEGEVVGAIETIRDVTNIRRVESELNKAKDAAEAANSSKSLFLAKMSHEIRTPMNAILGFAQLMSRDASLSPQSLEHLDVINRSGEHLLSLINDILEMSKIEAGRVVYSPVTFDLHRLLEDIELMFRVRTDAKGLSLLVERTAEVPRWVNTDESKLRQVLINLVGNAVKFTDEGGIALRIGVRNGEKDKNNLLFEVEDTGPGISQDEIQKLFQPFEQAGAGRRSGGTGLGLALSRGFVVVMGGAMMVDSTVGKGSIFRFNVPFSEGKADEVE
ncbi:MAG: PAS domain S-box protein, partial [Dehalococcoidia bacterium]